MKLLYVIAVCATALMIDGCGNGKETAIQGLVTERSGMLSGAKIAPESTVLMSLEATRGHRNDTGTIGVDSYVVHVGEAQTRTFCLDNANSLHRFSLLNGAGETVLDMKQGCKTLHLEAGDYTYRFENAATEAGRTHTVFVHSKADPEALGAVAVQDTVPKTRALIDSPLSGKTAVDFDRCRGCNLDNADLSHISFNEKIDASSASIVYHPAMDPDYFTMLGTDEDTFFGAMRFESYSGRLDLRGASLKHADLSYSAFVGADFDGVDFTEANLTHALFIGCSFAGTTWNRTDLHKAVFIDANWTKDYTVESVIVSRPSVTRLFRHQRTDLGGTVVAAVDSDGRLVLIEDNQARSVVLPGNLYPVSAPVVVTNNFYGGYSVFVKASDGKVHEYLYNGWKDGLHGTLPEDGWHVLPGSERCKSVPDATFLNMGGAGFNEVLNKVLCHDEKGSLYQFQRYFYNKYDTQRKSKFSSWERDRYEIVKTSAALSFNRYNDFVYAAADGLRTDCFDKTCQRYSVVPFDIASKVDLRAETKITTPSGEAHFAYVRNDENVYVSYLDMFQGVPKGKSRASVSTGLNESSLGHPPYGALSTPAIGSLAGNGEKIQVIVLSGDGELYRRNADGSNAWRPLPGSVERTRRRLTFASNDLTQTYFGNMDLRLIDFGSSTLYQTFFKTCSMDGASFANAELDGVRFKSARLFDNADFGGATVKNGVWKHCKFRRPNFQHTVFSGTTVAEGNEFYAVSGIRADFTEAEHIPLALIYGPADAAGADASKLRGFDFTGATFDALDSLDFRGADLSGAHMAYVTFERSDGTELDMNGSNWSGADLRHAAFIRCRLSDARLNGSVQAENIRFKHTNLQGAKLNGNFKSSLFDHCDISGMDASGAQMNLAKFDAVTTYKEAQTKFVGTNFDAVTFNAVQLRNVDFYKADISSSTFSGRSKLIESNFKNSIFSEGNALLADVVFDGCCFDGVSAGNINDDNNVTYSKSGTTAFTVELFGTLMPTQIDYRLDSGCTFYKPQRKDKT